MTTERWQQIQKLFHEALERPEAERISYVETSCSTDAALLFEVLSMLEEDARASSLLDRGLNTVAASFIGQPGEQAPRQIGPYQIERILGEGGMGIVCLAKRSDVGTTVAIKLLRDAWMSPARRERFAVEQKTLAQLQHANIARLYDAGSTSEGTPWFAMEYVDGSPLTEYCNTHRLTLTERLRLFRSVCEAVDYAHRHTIIHRDLKPNNILVTVNGEVKLLDFSIAKQLDAEDEVALKTRTGLRMMTPAYAAPEQIRGTSVSIQTDVYSLGVVLYELLTDRLPFIAVHDAFGELERMIVETEPAKPSVVARSGTAGRSAWADLDVLCLTAMHKEPERRYRSVEALIRDLDHYLKGQPLEARPDRFSYRAVKFLRRNRVSVSVGAAVFAAVVGMVMFFTINLTRARNAALAESARTQTIQRFMLNLFDAGDEKAGPSNDLKVVDLLDRGIQDAKGLDREPLIQAELYRTLGNIYEKIGKFDQADSLLRLALDRRREMLGNDHADVAKSTVDLGLLRADQAKFDEAEKLARDGLETARRALPPQDPMIAEATLALGKVLDAKGAYDKAIPVLEEALKLAELHGPNTREVAESLVALSSAHFYLGHHDICDALNKRALDLHKRLNGEQHPLVAEDLINLGASQFERGEYVKAEPYFRQALEINEAFYGPDHYETAASLTHLGRTLEFQKRYDESTAALERALSIQERVNGPTHPRVASNLNELGNIASMQQRYPDAEKRFQRVLEIYKTVYPSSHYLIGVAMSNLASVYMNSQQLPRAEELFREALQIYSQSLPADHVNVGITHIKLGRTLLREKRYSEAEKETHAGHDIVAKQSSPSISFLQAARHDLGEEYEALHQPDKAAEFRTAVAK